MIEQDLPGLLCQLERTVTLLSNRALSASGITLQQVLMLDAIHSHPGLPLISLSQILRLDRTTFTRNVELLVKMNWVNVSRGTDARFKCYSLTQTGTNMLGNGKTALLEHTRQLARRMGAELYNQTCQDLSDCMLTFV